MLSLLKHHWRPDRTDDARKNANLGIQYGEFGARLTHNHRTQFYFVMQSLMLWLEVSPRLCCLICMRLGLRLPRFGSGRGGIGQEIGGGRAQRRRRG